MIQEQQEQKKENILRLVKILERISRNREINFDSNYYLWLRYPQQKLEYLLEACGYTQKWKTAIIIKKIQDKYKQSILVGALQEITYSKLKEYWIDKNITINKNLIRRYINKSSS